MLIGKRLGISLCSVTFVLSACGTQPFKAKLPHINAQYQNLTAPLPKGIIATFGSELTLENGTSLAMMKSGKTIWSETREVKKLSYVQDARKNIYLAESVGQDDQAYLIGFRINGEIFLNKTIGKNTTFHFISPQEIIFESQTKGGKLYLQDMRIRANGIVETMITKEQK